MLTFFQRKKGKGQCKWNWVPNRAVTITGSEDNALNTLPKFATDRKILTLAGESIYFFLKPLVTTEFSSHFHAFKILKARYSCRRIISYFEAFETYLPAHLIKLFGFGHQKCNYVATRYCVPVNSKEGPFRFWKLLCRLEVYTSQIQPFKFFIQVNKIIAVLDLLLKILDLCRCGLNSL